MWNYRFAETNYKRFLLTYAKFIEGHDFVYFQSVSTLMGIYSEKFKQIANLVNQHTNSVTDKSKFND